MIELKNVSKYYNNNGVITLGLRNINLTFEKNEIVAIVGESGSGKSTLLNVICGVDSYEEGEILFNGYETSYFNQEDMDTFRRKNVSFIYQNYNIIESYTVLENVMFPLLINGSTIKEAKEKAIELIEKVGLKNRINHRGTKLSGGEKQRCIIARALATNSPILACDEPTGNLDSKTGEEIINLIKEVAKDKLVLIVSHNYEQVEGIVTRTIRISDGEVVADSNVNHNQTLDAKDGDILGEEGNKINLKTLGCIALNNLRRTPKKNIFIFSVLFVLSLIGLYLIGGSYSMSIESQYNPYAGYSNTVREKVIVYDIEHRCFDSSIFDKYENYVNAFYEENKYSISLGGMKYIDSFGGVSLTCHMPYNIYNKFGDDNVGEDRAFLVFPQAHNVEKEIIDLVISNDIYLSDDYKVDVVGCAECSEISYPLLVVSKEQLEQINPYAGMNSFVYVNKNSTNRVQFSDTISKPVLIVDNKDIVINDLFYILYNDTYRFKVDDYDLVVKDDVSRWYGGHYSDYQLIIPMNHILDNCYELTIYTNDISSVEALASANGLKTIVPAKSGSQVLSLSFFIFAFTVICSSFILLFLTLISYVVLHKVYQSRKKDYAIMRSLGLMKTQMARILRFEVLSLGIVASLCSLLAFFILGKTMYSYDPIGAESILVTITNPIFIIVYFVVMFLFDLLLAHRFNKRLFKFSVTKTIKEVF